ncbi:hypothetical protein ACKFKF_00795 [Phormidesmis sp. 146-12]
MKDLVVKVWVIEKVLSPIEVLNDEQTAVPKVPQKLKRQLHGHKSKNADQAGGTLKL